MAGYLLCETGNLHDPQRRAFIPLHGHAILQGESTEVYREMYARLAPELLRAGIFDHQVEIPASDRLASDAWFSLSFGQRMHIATRALDPVKGVRRGFDVRLAGPSDLDEVFELFYGLCRYNTTSPMFWPNVFDVAAWRRETEADLANPAYAVWTAYDRGRAEAVMFIRPTIQNFLDRPERTAHVAIAFARKDARHGGIGSVVLEHCVSWARENGFQRIALDYLTFNLTGARFWEGHGFRPTATILQRLLDSRLAWADGSNE
jgi:GNAT superfamily N-acetyltransferase